jgi:hypothetical protein
MLLQFAHTIQCCLWCLVRHRHRLHLQPPYAAHDIYTQLAVLNNQRLRDFDTVVLKDGPHIRK